MLTAERVWHSPCKGHQVRAMAPYRVYWFGPDSHIVAEENIECASDEEAQAKAREATRNRAAKGVWRRAYEEDPDRRGRDRKRRGAYPEL